MSKKCYWGKKGLYYYAECDINNKYTSLRRCELQYMKFCPYCGKLITLDAPDPDADRKDEEARESALRDARGYKTGMGYL